MQRCCFPPALFCIHSWRSTGGRQQLARCPPPPGGALALASFYTGSDHHLTTPSSQPVPCIVCTSQHSFITTTTSAGSCAHYTISGAGSCYLPVRHSSPTRLLRPTTLLPKALGVTIFFRAKYISIFHLFFSIILHDSKPLLINDLCAFWFFPVNSDIAADAYPSILACLLFMCYSKRNKESRIVASHDLIAHLR